MDSEMNERMRERAVTDMKLAFDALDIQTDEDMELFVKALNSAGIKWQNGQIHWNSFRYAFSLNTLDQRNQHATLVSPDVMLPNARFFMLESTRTAPIVVQSINQGSTRRDRRNRTRTTADDYATEESIADEDFVSGEEQINDEEDELDSEEYE
ncbi:uncharacterized protein B0P05DRAFT_590718 [Gilbertella persicaria]|uniref:uncharacterized protein n=1 Tax=Gilbertella persicaria TaxID=101096 RepID=UPI00221F29E0|nr:uncharacterized protein B0P05DRAFT_590718 [Gilbertella persicaria]KAI8060611.1 hypothetical protein B0P05DRAFT_590718 [Gilbertella persicaria]